MNAEAEAAEVEQEAQQLSVIVTALVVGWALIVVAYFVQRLLFPLHSLLGPNTGASVAASAFWLAFVLFMNALWDLLGLGWVAARYESLMRWLVTTRPFRSRWLPVAAFFLGLLFARFFWNVT